MNDETIIYEYRMFPEHLGITTWGNIKNKIIEKGANESILKEMIDLLLISGKDFVQISFHSPEGHISFPMGYRLKKFTWWERNFSLIDPM